MRLSALLLLLATASPALAADPPPPTQADIVQNVIGPPLPRRPPGFEALSWAGRADRLLKDGDAVGLIQTYDRAVADNADQAMLDWASHHLSTDDRHAIIADLVGRRYEQAAAQLTDPAQHEGALRGAAIYKAIALALTIVDGAACADPTARQERVDERLASGKAILDWYRQAPAPLRTAITARALSIESDTFGKAPPDPTLCWAGRDIWQHADQAHRTLIGQRDDNGLTIRSYYVPTTPGWTAPLRDDALSARQAAHVTLRAGLQSLLDGN